MESSELVIDTSIFIDFLRAKDKKKTHLYKLSDSQNRYVTSVTVYELYIGATDDQKIADINILIQDLIVLPFDDIVSIKAAEIYHELRKANKMIEFRHIFIAATCIVHQLPIKTLNKSHFSRIKGLKLC